MHIADHIDSDGAQASQCDSHMRVAKLRLQSGADGSLRIPQREPSHLNLARFRQRDGSFPIDGACKALGYSAPHADAEFISTAKHIIRSERNIERHRIDRGRRMVVVNGKSATGKHVRAEALQFLRRVRNLRVKISQGKQIVRRFPAKRLWFIRDIRLYLWRLALVCGTSS